MTVTALAYVGVGGALGAMSRYALTVAFARAGYALTLGTLLSNLAGCFIMGVVLQWLADSHWFHGTSAANEYYRLLFAVGFCGSFTTLSALVYELTALVTFGQALQAAGYLALSVVGGIAAFYGGIGLVRLLLPSA